MLNILPQILARELKATTPPPPPPNPITRSYKEYTQTANKQRLTSYSTGTLGADVKGDHKPP